ncbi:hypothetical protein PAXRUDRAFT_20411 [Paxillus rubicundulus Ve08.2h10]|uniref:Uncharacterized protein n=1 Tax=Paxillus rubicundulus Ve08.2h10 TaxID=930991 RepID=A0A0D0CSK2_9AGAM|nr:hypothetical protein PAXRUDRAFT_20411 [Paxillus rubicundulus Ve08.2h10]
MLFSPPPSPPPLPAPNFTVSLSRPTSPVVKSESTNSDNATKKPTPLAVALLHSATKAGCCTADSVLAEVVIFRAAQVNSASLEPTPDQVRFLRPPFLHFSTLRSSASPPSVPLHFRLLLNILVPVP